MDVNNQQHPRSMPIKMSEIQWARHKWLLACIASALKATLSVLVQDAPERATLVRTMLYKEVLRDVLCEKMRNFDPAKQPEYGVRCFITETPDVSEDGIMAPVMITVPIFSVFNPNKDFSIRV